MRAVKGSAVALLFIKRAFGIHFARARAHATENFIRVSARGGDPAGGEGGDAQSVKKRKIRDSLA